MFAKLLFFFGFMFVHHTNKDRMPNIIIRHLLQFFPLFLFLSLLSINISIRFFFILNRKPILHNLLNDFLGIAYSFDCVFSLLLLYRACRCCCCFCCCFVLPFICCCLLVCCFAASFILYVKRQCCLFV